MSATFFGIVAIYCLWIFSFPVFPTQDGPVHLYYTSVLHHLANHSALFEHYYSLKLPPPPYIVHYLLLFVLTSFLPAFMAEKIVVAICVLLFCLGARFLLKSISPQYELYSLLILPLALNGMLGLGFHNYCLSIGMSFFAIGFWLRSSKSSVLTDRLSFLALVFLMLVTHPVPLIVTLVVVTGELVVRTANGFWAGRFSRFSDVVRSLKLDLVFCALAYCSLLYIAVFISRGQTSENLQHPLIQVDMLMDFIHGRPLMLVTGRFRGNLYRDWLFALLAALTAAGISAAVRNLKRRQFTMANFFSVVGLVALLGYPLIPRNMNGSDYFADRLVIYLWMFAIAGCSGVYLNRPKWRTCAVFAASFAALAVIAVDNGVLKQVSKTLASIENEAIRNPGARGVGIEVLVSPAPQTTFAPYFWAAATYFRVTGSVMMNSPWLELKISPLNPKNDLFVSRLPARLTNFPYRILDESDRPGEVRDLVTEHADFAVLVGASTHEHWVEKWSCQKEEWYSVCHPPQ